MTTPLRIVGIAGSLRQHSYNRAALRAAQALAPSAGAEIQIAELEGIPPFNEDQLSNLPPAVRALRDAVLPADAVLFVTPEYNYSIPGVLKNAIDWCSRPPAASVCAASRSGSWGFRRASWAPPGRNTTCGRSWSG